MRIKFFYGVYTILLIYFVILKFSFNIEDTLSRIEYFRDNGFDKINITLFSTIKMQLSNLDKSWAIQNILGNTIPFIIYGILFELSFKLSTFIAMIINILFIVVLESIQLFLYIGTFDIDDILLNSFSIFLGIVVIKKIIILKGDYIE